MFWNDNTLHNRYINIIKYNSDGDTGSPHGERGFEVFMKDRHLGYTPEGYKIKKKSFLFKEILKPSSGRVFS